MKKILLAASAVALLAAAGCADKKGTSTAVSGADTVTVAASASVAYFNLDTLLTKYDMYIDMRASYEEKVQKADAELTSKGRALERNVRDYQEKVQNGLVTRAQAQTIEENLNKQQQAFVSHRDKVMGEMAEEEQVMLNQIQYSITEYLKEFNKDYQYGVILSTTTAGPIFNADPKLGDLGNAMVIKKLPDAFETFIENLPVDMYSVPEYRKLNIFNGGNVYEYDTRQIVPFGGVSRITYKQSFIPPYRTTLYFNEERIQYTPNNFISFNNDATFMDFSSAYADWYRQNYNSQIMGLKVKQETERENLGVRTAAGLANTVVGIGATLARGQISAALNKNAAAPALAGVNAAKQATDFATNTISNYLTLNNNQAKERKLQEFQIQDLKNTPSEVSFGSSIVPFIVNKMYMRVVVFKNIFYDEIVKYHKAYGFESMIDISDSFQQHTLFDYYRADDTVLNTDEVFLDEMERSQVEDTFSKGVRVWYDYNNMKNFTIENPEKAV